MVIAADYPFLDVFFTMILFFFWVAWIWVLVSVLTDVFRRHDIHGWGKAGWTFFLILVPFLGVLVYLIAHGKDMAKRDAERIQEAQSQYAQMAGATNSATEIEKASALLQSGTITQAEFDAIKAKALA